MLENGVALPKSIFFYHNGLVEPWKRLGYDQLGRPEGASISSDDTMENRTSISLDPTRFSTNTFCSCESAEDQNVDFYGDFGTVSVEEGKFPQDRKLSAADSSWTSSSGRDGNSSTATDAQSRRLNLKHYSAKSFESVDSKTNADSLFSGKYRWTDDMEAKNSVIMALTAFYAMIITIFALVFELSRLLTSENKRYVGYKDVFFGVYMYGLSIAFLGYCYIVLLLNPRWLQAAKRIHFAVKEGRIRLKKKPGDRRNITSVSDSKINTNKNTLSLSSSVLENSPSGTNFQLSLPYECSASGTTMTTQSSDVRRVSHDSPSAGSLFLRMGCVVFGVIGVVYYAFSIYLCASDRQCEAPAILLDILSIIFVFTQMHFVFCNWKLSITGSQIVARLGTMHLIASNLWTWIRYILIEESMLNDEIRHVFTREITFDDEVESPSINSNSSMSSFLCQGAECVLASMSELMSTSIVEYSLISAGVMLIVWRNIDFERKIAVYVKRKHQIRINCSRTTNGLFFGLAYMAFTFTTMAIFSGYTLMGQSRLAAIVFSSSDIAQYSMAIAGSLMALWQIRKLHFHSKSCPNTVFAFSGSNNSLKSCRKHSQELLDIVLLAFGMTGEMIYSVAGLLGLSAYNDSWESLSTVLLLVHITRIMQVGLQSCLIYIAGKLSIHGDPLMQKIQPGKQAITFLLLANISMFLMNLLEAEKAGISDAIVDFYGRRSWVFLVRSFSPLTIFYRFHSAVCLAEVWKTTYSSKE